ncbi:MAG: hypothetical protein ACM3SP_04390 [Chloroflexota bacterium]
MYFPTERWLKARFVPVAVFAASVMSVAGCVPPEAVQKPTLNEVRSGTVQGQITEDNRLQPGEVQAEVDEIDRGRQEIHALTQDGRRRVVRYDVNRTRVIYHGWEYAVDNIEAGDLIAYFPASRASSYVDTIRIQEPVQARTAPSAAQRLPPRPRNDVVEGTVDRIDPNLGVFDIRPRSGRTITVSVPYNARAADVDYFRSLRRGDRVRVEGEFVNGDNLQLLSFLSSRER